MRPEELAYCPTPLGDLVLRRRPEPRLENSEVYEVKLGEEFLMSSLFSAGEVELANLGLTGLHGELDVVVGGLGLGYTAAAALDHENVSRLLVIDTFQEVIEWHANGLVPLGPRLTGDSRCSLLQGDFFTLARTGFDSGDRHRKFDAVLLDIDHTPEHYLDPSNSSFYGIEGLTALRNQLKPGGAFALWSNDPPEEDFTTLLESVFGQAGAKKVEFGNPYTGLHTSNSVYVAHKRIR